MASGYTGKGDDGTSGLLSDERAPKFDLRFEALGALDEANSALGIARSNCRDAQLKEIILVMQRGLYKIMSEVAAAPKNVARFKSVGQENIAWVEGKIDDLYPQAKIPKGLILPGDSPSGAALDLARTVVRRAERRVAELFYRGVIENQYILKYMNRLSSLCFIMEIIENQAAGVEVSTPAAGAGKRA